MMVLTFVLSQCFIVKLLTKPIAGFHSRDQQPYFSTKTKGSVCIIIELNSRRIWSGHQHGRLFFV